MIKLKELLELNEMTYNDGPTEKHQDRIDRPICICRFNVAINRNRH